MRISDWISDVCSSDLPYLDNITEGKKGSLGWMFDNALPGNTLVARYGEPVFMRRFNNLPSAENAKIQTFGYPATTTHLHNAHVGSESDGFPMDFMEPGEFWDHHYAMIYAHHDEREALGSLWYHDRMNDFTATNVYAGLSGMAIFYDHIDSGDENDTNDSALRLPGEIGRASCRAGVGQSV